MKTIKERILAILVVIALFGLLSIGLLILSSNKYEDDIARLEINNKKLQHSNNELKHNISILQSKQECNCGWYEDFYYEHAEEIGANE